MAAPVVLVGNPNVGKSALFGALTGAYVAVSNYPGTTVELAKGSAWIGGERVRVVDTPGIASLAPASEDERVTRDLLLSTPEAVAVVVADAKNLERALVLLIELAELGVPLVLCLNMADEASARGLAIDEAALARRLGVPVVATVAIRRQGIGALRSALADAAVPSVRADAAALGEGATALADARRREAARLAQSVRTVTALRSRGRAFRQRLESVAVHPLWGWPLLVSVLACAYLFVGVFGAGTLVGLVEEDLFGRLVTPAVTRAVALLPGAFLRDLLAGPYGVLTMALPYAFALVLPIVATFFVAFGVLEDSGYLPRLAVMVNRAFRAMGVSGKAVLPMVLGLGCDTMATLTTRVLETARERLIVILLLALGVPCSAQLAVVLGLLRPLPASAAALWLGTVLASLFLVGRLAAALLPGQPSDFILELPPLRCPRPGNIAVKTLARVEWYLKEAVPLFVLGTLVLFAADRLRLLEWLQRAGRPVVTGLLGLPAATTETFVVGFLRRDFGAAGLFRLSEAGALSPEQTVVAVVTVTLFIPCVASFFMIVKERGARTACAVGAFVTVFALGAGTLLRVFLDAFPAVLG